MKEELELLKLVTTRRELFRKGASGIGATPIYVGSPTFAEKGEGGVTAPGEASHFPVHEWCSIAAGSFRLCRW